MFSIKSFTFIYYYAVASLSLNIVVCMSEPNPSSNSTAFSVDLFHRYSPQSPSYDPSLYPTQIIVDAIRRSINLSKWLNQTHSIGGSGSTETDIEPSHSGSYFMRYKVGSKEVDSLGLMDTGSDLIWTQCFPCAACFKQSPPYYEPKASSTYKQVLCHDEECKMPRKTVCGSDICHYVEYYADQTNTIGVLSKDSFTLASAGGTTSWFPGFVFGCSLTSNSHEFKGFESGIIGLGRGRLSLVSQLGQSAKGKFSYCMMHLTEGRKRFTRLLFGDYSEVLGMEVVHTPLFLNKENPSAYYVKLFGFSVGGTKFIQDTQDENFVIDSGAVVTRLPDYMYNNLKSYVKKALGRLKTKTDPGGFLDLCFATGLSDPRMPELTFHFEGDINGYADVTFRDNNMFGKMGKNTVCLLVVSAGEGKASLGSMAQANFFVGYDTEKEQMSFERTDCTKFAY